MLEALPVFGAVWCVPLPPLAAALVAGFPFWASAKDDAPNTNAVVTANVFKTDIEWPPVLIYTEANSAAKMAFLAVFPTMSSFVMEPKRGLSSNRITRAPPEVPRFRASSASIKW
jgi:hypothetical protein